MGAIGLVVNTAMEAASGTMEAASGTMPANPIDSIVANSGEDALQAATNAERDASNMV